MSRFRDDEAVTALIAVARQDTRKDRQNMRKERV
jgi:hypothetical protein